MAAPRRTVAATAGSEEKGLEKRPWREYTDVNVHTGTRVVRVRRSDLNRAQRGRYVHQRHLHLDADRVELRREDSERLKCGHPWE